MLTGHELIVLPVSEDTYVLEVRLGDGVKGYEELLARVLVGPHRRMVKVLVRVNVGTLVR